MPTRRVQRRRRTRRNRRGGFLGIPMLKTDADNLANCKNYWPDYNCTKTAISKATTVGASYNDYPGLLKKKTGRFFPQRVEISNNGEKQYTLLPNKMGVIPNR